MSNLQTDADWRVLLVTTSDTRSGRRAELDRLLNSIAASPLRPKVELLLLLQRCDASEFAAYSATLPDFVRAFHCEAYNSLSAARNLLLGAVWDTQRNWRHTMVAFPDDDGWYPGENLAAILQRFQQNEDLEFWFCRYGAEPVVAQFGAEKSATLSDVVRRASSNTLFFRGDLVKTTGFFDEKLGVGTAVGSSEDLDYALKAFAKAKQTRWLDAKAVGHRDPALHLRSRYYPGALLVLARHRANFPGARFEFFRKILVGCALVLLGQLRFSTFMAALRRAWRQPSKTLRNLQKSDVLLG